MTRNSNTVGSYPSNVLRQAKFSINIFNKISFRFNILFVKKMFKGEVPGQLCFREKCSVPMESRSVLDFNPTPRIYLRISCFPPSIKFSQDGRLSAMINLFVSLLNTLLIFF